MRTLTEWIEYQFNGEHRIVPIEDDYGKRFTVESRIILWWHRWFDCDGFELNFQNEEEARKWIVWFNSVDRIEMHNKDIYD